jgi:hypothetical protein
MVTHQTFFYYKYALVQNDYVVGWERGVDRVADLELMPDSSVTQNSFKPPDYFYDMEDECKIAEQSDFKRIQLNETWEKLWVSFMVYHPYAEATDEILFTCDKVGVSMQPMAQMTREFEWMDPKYGTNVRPW